MPPRNPELTKTPILWSLLALLLSLLAPGLAHAGKLQTVRNEVWPSPLPSATPSPTRQVSYEPAPPPVPTAGYRVHHTRVIRPLYVNPPPHRMSTHCGAVECSATEVPSVPAKRTVPRFSNYPYEEGSEGYVRRVPIDMADGLRRVAARIGLEGSYVMGGVWRLGGTLDLHFWRLGLVNELHGYFERRDPGRVLYFGTSHATFDVVMFPRVQLRFGPGITYMIDGGRPGQRIHDYAVGPSIMGGLDVFAWKPVIVSLRADRGRLPSADTFSLRGTIGAMIDRGEVYAGYDYRRIGPTASLHGPIAGIRLWF